jgi:hypothetical protein
MADKTKERCAATGGEDPIPKALNVDGVKERRPKAEGEDFTLKASLKASSDGLQLYMRFSRHVGSRRGN